ncbi:replication protein [Lactobacillus brevis] [Lactiplantibacillus mudanjiangensis]|uniref:replication protein n=1 Tax=Lactiplantibacillus mudanjiangensis TaxID=1296538 RepID=UPI0010156F84|nr:replication protein [Lactobacillus brevis] [Lactiplantibacillus mudanjiangensis]
MADSQFSLADAIVPSLFAPYVQQLTTETDRFINSGIVTNDPSLGAQLLSPSDFITMPFTNDLEGEPESWTDTNDISVAGLTTGKQRAFKFRQVKAFGFTDISGLVSGANPQEVIATRFGNYWVRVNQKVLLQELAGIFANTDIATAKLFDDSANSFGARGFLATIAKMGDLQDQTFSKIAVHSATYAQMKVQQMIDVVQPGQAVGPFGNYNGMEIVVDDQVPLDGNVATSYIFGTGSVGFSVASPQNGVEVEREARKNGGRTNIINRRVMATHVLGTSVAKDFTPAGQTVTADELALGTTWESVVDPRNIRIAAYKSKIDSDFVPKKRAQSSSTSTSTTDSSKASTPAA